MERQYIRTERAHLMCPNMHFGLLVTLNDSYDDAKAKMVIRMLAEAHPFLRSVIRFSSNGDDPYYKVLDESKVRYIEKENASEYYKDMKRVSKKGWDIFKDGLLIVYGYKNEDKATFLFLAHHLLADGKGLLGLVKEFAHAYVGGVELSPVEENLIKGLSDLPDGSGLPSFSKLLINQANARWMKERQYVPYEQYQDFSIAWCEQHPVTYEEREVSDDEWASMREMSKGNGVTINDIIVAQTLIETGAKSVVVATDLRKDLTCYRKGALGNYSSAFTVKSNSKVTDELMKAQEIHETVRKIQSNPQKRLMVLSCYLYMQPTLIDAAAISALGGCNSKAGTFVGVSMFGMGNRAGYSITNLGLVEDETIKDAMFIPPASPAMKKTLGVLTVNNKIRICESRYDEDVPQKKESK